MSELIGTPVIGQGLLPSALDTKFSDERKGESERKVRLKILAFAASSSRNSINKALVSYAARLLGDEEVEIVDINEYEMPLYSVDRELETGIPEQAREFYEKIGKADALLIAFAEHNGFYTAAYKNLFDWTTRIDRKVYQDKPVVLLAASPGPGGARRVLQVAKDSAPTFGMEVKAELSVPRFYENFDLEYSRINNPKIQGKLESALARLH
jgi:NAD(P)H-dependent FMN reductase